MKKQALVKRIIAHLTADLKLYYKAAMTARAEATDEQSKAENKYDTRGLEASYLARGQSKQAAETELAIEDFEKLTLALRSFGPKDGIDVGAYVELENKGDKFCYFLGPRAGGTEVTFEKQEVVVITMQSPLGQQLAGKKQGEKLKMEIGGAKSDYKIVTVA